MLGLTTTRRLRREVALKQDLLDEAREQRDNARKGREEAKTAAATAARQFTDADDKYIDVCLVNACLTDDLTAARERIAEYGVRRTVPEVLEDHDVHRKGIADALGDQKRHLNWGQLIAEVARLAKSAVEWKADFEAEKKRADHLQQRYDDAVGLPAGRIKDSSRWQPGYVEPKPKADSA